MSHGEVKEVIGAVVDVEFNRDAVPHIYNALRIDDNDLTLEVQQQMGDGVVRTIAMGSTDGLKRGAAGADTGCCRTRTGPGPIRDWRPRCDCRTRPAGILPAPRRPNRS